MTLPVTRTKTVLPRRRSDILSRPRLLDLLYELLDNKLILVAAPAGYGKTSLLVDFAHQADLPVCWYALDELDNDPLRFTAHLIESIRYRFAEFGKESTAALESLSQQSVQNLVPVLINDAFDHIREHFLLVIDDYHLVNENKEISDFLDGFLRGVDENCHIVLASRNLVSLDALPLMVARSQVGGLSFEELAFRADEIQSLILQNYHMSIPDEAARKLEQESDGWITGLLLSAQTMWQGMTDRLRVARVSGVGLYEYLAQQVLDQQPPDIRRFLLKSSLLGEFNAELCQAVFGAEGDWSQDISYITQNILFVTPVDDTGQWIRYHHLFGDFLQNRLQIEDPQEAELLLRRLAAVYMEWQEWERAYQTYRRLDDNNGIANLLDEAGSDILKQGRAALLQEWIKALPLLEIDRHPRIQSLEGAILTIQGQQKDGLAQLSSAVEKQSAGQDTAGYVMTLHRRATALRMLGKFSEALIDAEEARRLAGTDPNLTLQEATAIREIGVNLYHQGNLHTSINNLSQALKRFERLKDDQSTALVHMELGLGYTELGEYRKALSSYQQALEYWRTRKNPLQQSPLLNNLGVLSHAMGNYVQANDYFEQALEIARSNGIRRMEGYILAGIGDLYTDLEAFGAAHQAYASADEINKELNDGYLRFYLLIAEAKLAVQEQNYALAEQLLQQAEAESIKDGLDDIQGAWLLIRGMLLLGQGKPSQAVNCLSLAINQFSNRQQVVETTRARLYLAFAQYHQKNTQAAFATLEQASSSLVYEESVAAFTADAVRTQAVLEESRHNAVENVLVERLLLQQNRFREQLPTLRRKVRYQATTIPFAAPRLSIYTFGKSQLELDGEAVTASEWQNQRRVREFFFCILAKPEGLTREEIGTLFWPETSPGKLKLKFKNLIYKLRYALGSEVVLFDDSRYWFNRSIDYHYDAEKFLELCEQAQNAFRSEEKLSALQAAFDLYHGPYLPDIDGIWVEENREFFRKRFLETGLSLVRIYLDQYDYDQAMAFNERLLTEDPCNEEAHRLAMRIYAAKGNRAAISRQFEFCREALKREIGVDPSPQTTDLYSLLVR